ncbi:MAG: DUF4301 family protein, partial [Bacteroidales bacterium]|nr:DUF4301 family protein [Bacteroidales bacterium]
MEFSAKDREQLQGHGLSVETVLGQLDRMCEARHALRVLRPAVPGDGIEVLSEQERNRLESSYDTLMQGRRCLKFVPASGAATRMFKKWFQWMGDCTPEAASELAETLPRYPFHPQLAEALRSKGTTLDKLDGPADYAELLRFILTDEGWNFGRMPKGLLPFHLYGE